jgi:hypothetical protein
MFAKFADVESRAVHVMSPAYITACVDAGAIVPPQPKHYMRYCPLAPMRDGTVAEEEADCFGDSYADDVDAEDVRMLLRDGSAAAQAVQDAAQREGPPAAELTSASRSAKAKIKEAAHAASLTAAHIKEEVDVDAILAEAGLASTRYNFLRGVRVLLLPLPPTNSVPQCDADAAAAAADDEARPLATARLGLCVRLHGGSVAGALDERVTHIVALSHGGWAAPAACGDEVGASLDEVLEALDAGDPARGDELRSRLDEMGHGAAPAVVTKAWLLGRLADAQRHVEAH